MTWAHNDHYFSLPTSDLGPDRQKSLACGNLLVGLGGTIIRAGKTLGVDTPSRGLFMVDYKWRYAATGLKHPARGEISKWLIDFRSQSDTIVS